MNMNRFNNSFYNFLIFSLISVWSLGCSDSQPDSTNNSPTQNQSDVIEQLNTQIASSPHSAELYFQRGKYYYDFDTYSEAIRDLIRCTEIDSSRADCWHLLADAYLDDNRSRPAIETLEDFLKIEPKRIATLLKLAEFQTIIKRFKAAHFNLNAILEQDQNHAEALFMKGYLYSQEEKPLQAVESLQRAIQSDPDLVDGHLLLGQLFEQAGNPMARKYYENAIRVAPDNADAKMALANYYWMANNYPVAISLYDNLLVNHPEFARAYYNKGLIYLELDSLNKAYDVLQKAASLQPDFILAHYYLGESKDLMNEFEGAKIHLEDAARLSPNDPKIKAKLSEVLDKIEKRKIN
jgi:tetratricopeptide (TPR) repeat protein